MFVSRKGVENRSLSEILERYEREVFPKKRGLARSVPRFVSLNPVLEFTFVWTDSPWNAAWTRLAKPNEPGGKRSAAGTRIMRFRIRDSSHGNRKKVARMAALSFTKKYYNTHTERSKKMKITEIAFTGTPVTDIKRAREFYEGVLGLNPTLETLGACR